MKEGDEGKDEVFGLPIIEDPDRRADEYVFMYGEAITGLVRIIDRGDGFVSFVRAPSEDEE